MIEHYTHIFGIAFGLGLVHALDADHILAVSALSANSTGAGRSVRYAFRWASGHGLMLLAIVVPWKLFGLQIPVAYSGLAEQLVGLVLILLGGLVIYRLRRQKLHLHFHSHAGMLPHAHWHPRSNGNETAQHSHEHKAYLIGGLHGLAGSAPLLALIPISQTAPVALAVSYLLIFSAGVFIAMICFGGVFGNTLTRLAALNQKYLVAIKAIIAMLAIATGVHLVSA